MWCVAEASHDGLILKYSTLNECGGTVPAGTISSRILSRGFGVVKSVTNSNVIRAFAYGVCI
jgi:hypothetical protein